MVVCDKYSLGQAGPANALHVSGAKSVLNVPAVKHPGSLTIAHVECMQLSLGSSHRAQYCVSNRCRVVLILSAGQRRAVGGEGQPTSSQQRCCCLQGDDPSFEAATLLD